MNVGIPVSAGATSHLPIITLAAFLYPSTGSDIHIVVEILDADEDVKKAIHKGAGRRFKTKLMTATGTTYQGCRMLLASCLSMVATEVCSTHKIQWQPGDDAFVTTVARRTSENTGKPLLSEYSVNGLLRACKEEAKAKS